MYRFLRVRYISCLSSFVRFLGSLSAPEVPAKLRLSAAFKIPACLLLPEGAGMYFVRRRFALLWWSASWASAILLRLLEDIRESACLRDVFEEILCLDITGDGGRTPEAEGQEGK